MDQLFRRLPLSFKLALIGIVPLIFIIYLTGQVYQEKNKNISIIAGYINRVNQIGNITALIHHLQQEQKLSFDVMKKKTGSSQLIEQRKATDSILVKLRRSNDYVLMGFEDFTSLHNLEATRNKMDSGSFGADAVTHFYSNTIFRLNTLTNTPYGSQTVLEPFYNEVQSQKLLTEITTYLGIIRTNIYNVLTTRQYMTETLLGTFGAYDIYKSYDTEFKLKANSSTLQSYSRIRNNTDFKPTLEYISKLFATFKFDSTYTAEQWWTVSENGLQDLAALQATIWKNVNSKIDAVYQEEISKKNTSLVLLILVTVIVLSIIFYTISVITKMLAELKQGAEKIALGGSGLKFNISSKDAIGSLADSISKIDANNKELINAAGQIGSGNFMTPVHIRSHEDMLANAIISMKDNLQSSIKAIEESKARFTQLADLMPQIVWTADERGQIDYYNRRWYEYTGDKEAASVIHPSDMEITQSTWTAALYEAKGFELETRLLNHNTGLYRWFLLRAIPIRNTFGDITKWFGTSTDIHERKTMSEELEMLVQKRTVELKRSNDDLLQFAHVTSHDMKEPLRKVIFFSDRLNKVLGENTSEKAKIYLSKIDTSARRLMAMIEGVLEFSTINSAGQTFEIIDLNAVIEGILNDLEMVIQQKGAVVTYTHLPGIKGVPVLIHQLFYNLIANALKFSKESTSPVITISAGTRKFKEAATGLSLHNDKHDFLEIKVEDNGIGISPDMNYKVFDVFARLHAREKYEGTGLGLALCKKIMESHEGFIYVKSEEDKGSTFHLMFPDSIVADTSNLF